MTEFEQQVAAAIDAAMVGGIADALAAGRLSPGELLAPRVAAAIEAASEDVWRAVAPAGDAGGDLAKARQEARESALAALRGET